MFAAIRTTALAAALAASGSAALADFRAVTDRSEFLQLVQGRVLKHPGVSLQVTPDGRIQGRGLAWDVTGEWSWNGNYFCRDIIWGGEGIGYNCQLVLRDGSTLRFVADQGEGRSADFRLR